MAVEKVPAFQFYPKDFLTDGNVAQMSMAERGAYITLICICWLEGTLPVDPKRLAHVVGLPCGAFSKLWTHIAPCFRPSDQDVTRLLHPRLEKERAKQESFRQRQSMKGRSGAMLRWQTGDGRTIAVAITKPKPDDSRSIAGGMAGPMAGGQPKHSSPISDLHSLSDKEHQKDTRASLSPPADPFLNAEVTKRAGAFIEHYQELYPLHRHGARYAVKPQRDYAAAVTLCTTWLDDHRLEKLAVIFLTTDHKFAEEGSRTIPQFLALASWADGRLAAHEARKASA